MACGVYICRSLVDSSMERTCSPACMYKSSLTSSFIYMHVLHRVHLCMNKHCKKGKETRVVQVSCSITNAQQEVSLHAHARDLHLQPLLCLHASTSPCSCGICYLANQHIRLPYPACMSSFSDACLFPETAVCMHQNMCTTADHNTPSLY
jgi:hypothetical protein